MSRSQFHPDNYALPVANSSVPPEWLSNSDPKPIASSLTTAVITSLSANQAPSGRSEISIPLGQSAGILTQGYIKMTIRFSGCGNAGVLRFKGHNALATSVINRYTFSVNGVPIDTIQNADRVYTDIISHASSAPWLRNDAVELLYANRPLTVSAGGIASITVCIPLLGLLGANAFPAYLCNGTANIALDYNTVARSIRGDATVAAAAPTFEIQNVQFICDRVNPEQQFIDSVRGEISMGKKFVLPYTAIQSTSLVESAGNNNLQMGVNVSSLRGVVMSHALTADLTTVANFGYSESNSLSQFQVSCDGRLLSNVVYDAVNTPAVVFAESQKSFSRLLDSAVSDAIGAYDYTSLTNTSNYLTQSFFAGVSGMRCASNLQFTGTPVSVLGIQWSVLASTYTAFFTVLADQQCLIDASGNVELVR
jgi:hypothetical protein